MLGYKNKLKLFTSFGPNLKWDSVCILGDLFEFCNTIVLVKVVKIGILGKIVGGRWDRGS